MLFDVWRLELLNLPDVTLVMIETQEHQLAKKAIEDSISKVKFGEVFVFTDKPETFDDCADRIYTVDDWPNKVSWSRFSWYGPTPFIRTSHQLQIQWDSWVFDADVWKDDWLKYDYIGSPWWYADGRNVGNGGFSLRSTRLHRFLMKHRDKLPCTSDLDDDLLCRKYRPILENEGFEWAPERVATDFAFEWKRPYHDSRHFGFHALYNFGEVLNEEEMIERTKLVLASPYIRSRENIWDVFTRKYSGVLAKINAMNKEFTNGCIT